MKKRNSDLKEGQMNVHYFSNIWTLKIPLVKHPRQFFTHVVCSLNPT